MSFDINPIICDASDIDRMWSFHAGYIYQCNDPINAKIPFYPLYKYKNFYSFSIFPLIKFKNCIKINNDFVQKYVHSSFDVAGPEITIDQEIIRIGAAQKIESHISNIGLFVREISNKMQHDIDLAIKNNPGKTHFILCGGKDSLNILLLKWSSPVIAISAEPNYDFVLEFVKKNKLDIDVMKLEDIDPGESIEREIAEASCLVDLSHWRWTTHLKKIASDYDQQVIFWKGQVADAFLTDYWRSYTSNSNSVYKKYRKVIRRLARIEPATVDRFFGEHVLQDFQQSLWRRAAVAQGAHLGFLRSICNALVLSAYHGPETTKVLYSMDLQKLTAADLRPAIGEALLGRPVRYPPTNPAPPPSVFRIGLRSRSRYVAALRNMGINEVS